MGETSFSEKFPVGIEHTGYVKPLTEVDTDEELVVELLHGTTPWCQRM
jgi:hypothetical protein